MLCRSRQKNPLLSPTHTLLLHLLILLAGAAPPAETSSAVNSLSPAAPAARPPSTLDPKQLTALQSMGLSVGRDPCGNPSPHDNATACDSSSPFRHLISLRLANCSPDLDLSPTALRSLHTLRSLSFFRCPIAPIKHFPPPLASALRSFSCISSLRPLPALLLSHLRNLTLLSVKDVPISDSSPFLIFSQMHSLCSATISNASLSGQLPRHWHSISLTHLDLSSNALKGPVPGSISLLESLESLNLSSNSLSGPLPDAIGDLIFLKIASFARNSLSGPIPETMAALPELAQLDLSYNQFNESIPRFLSEMNSLKHLNLESNNFQGVIPFNASFIERLEVFKVSGNGNLCYNRSVLSSKLMLGIAPCDKYGLPVPPPPGKADRDDSFSDYDYGGEDDGGGGDGKGGGGRHGVNRLVLGVAIGLSCLVFLLIFLVCLSKLWA